MKNKLLKNFIVSISIFGIVCNGGVIFKSKVHATDIGLRDERIYGKDRYETSAKLSQQGYSESYYAVLVNGINYPDAITSSPIAYKYNAPVLLTQVNNIPNVIVNELKRLKTKKVIIVGGTGVVSNNVVKQLTKMGITIQERISGADRFDTSINVATHLVPKNYNGYVVKDNDWISAIMISSLACREQSPIIYSSNIGIKKVGADTLRSREIKNFDILDANAVSEYDTNTYATLTQNGWYKDSMDIYTVGGRTRNILNDAILEHYSDKFDLNTIYIVSDKSFADGLSIATLAGATYSPIFVVGNNNIEKVEKYIGEHTNKIHNVKIIGGTSLIPENFIDKVWKYNFNMSENNNNDIDDWTFGNGEKITNGQATKIVREKTGNDALESSIEGCGSDTDYTDTGVSLSDRRFWWFWNDSGSERYYVDVQNGDVFKMIEDGIDKNIFQQI